MDRFEKIFGDQKKWKITLFTALVFLLVSSPFAYRLVDNILGNFIDIADPEGKPTMAGMIIHTLVFLIIIRISLEFEIF